VIEEGRDKPELRRVDAGLHFGTWLALGTTTAFLVAVVIFTVDNSQDVSVSFVKLHAQFPLALCLLCAAIAGVAAVVEIQVVWRVRARRAEHRQKH
jgi:uncharacterized integral membrane protein